MADLHDQLVEAGKRWLQRTHPIVISELATSGEEPDVIGWHQGLSTLIECKASVSDFHADRKKMFRQFPQFGVGNYRWFLTLPGLIKVESLPDKWGLLEITGSKFRTIRKAELFDVIDHRHEKSILISTIRRIGASAPEGCSIKCYTIDTKNRATLGIEAECQAEEVVA